MTVNKKRNVFFLLLTAFIWGTAFVAQTTGGQEVGPYTFICLRYMIGAAVLLPVIRLMDSLNLTGRRPVTREQWKKQWKAGVCCGLCLFFASGFQQVGIFMGTAAGKAGFLTACYIVLVPVLGLFLGKKCGRNIWIAVMITVVGLYLLCMSGSLSMERSDILVLICSLLFAAHILTIDHFVDQVDPVRMSCIQFFTAGIAGIVPMFFFDMSHSAAGLISWAYSMQSVSGWISLLYAGVLSSGIAYTLQIVGQQGVDPTVASLLMSLESVFSVIAGWVILGQAMGPRELLGCALIFIAVVLAQLPQRPLSFRNSQLPVNRLDERG